jgi:glycosyltransferase involved in cell wall biosynthesis
MNNRISIALCTYNGSKFLAEQLESFMQQTILPDELVVCDDCSSDNTTEILRKFQRKAPFPVRLYNNEINLGYTKNFEKAISLCTGDIIFLSDQDDVWLPEKIELIKNEFEKSSEVGLVFTDAELVDENLNPLGKRLWDRTFQDEKRKEFRRGKEIKVLAFGSTATGATMAFRSELKKICLPIPCVFKGFIHDGWITLTATLFFRVVPLENPLIKYRQHAGQQIGVNFEALKDRSPEHSRREAYQNAVNSALITKNEIRIMENFFREFLDDTPYKPVKPEAATNFFSQLDEIDQMLDKVIQHNLFRRDIPKNRLYRIPKVLSELSKGNYQKFSRGILSAGLDLTERID